MARGVVAAAHEVVQRDIEVVREGDEFCEIRLSIPIFIPLIGQCSCLEMCSYIFLHYIIGSVK